MQNDNSKFKIEKSQNSKIEIPEKFQIPDEILGAVEKLQAAGFEAYLVGGCVRDLLMKKTAKDWDITTNALPEQIQKIFSKSVYENNFGTVGVFTESENESLKIVEITPFRLEEKYSDKRHPDSVQFAGKLEDDLARRDFTINAMALKIQNSNLKSQNDPSSINLRFNYGAGNLKFKIKKTSEFPARLRMDEVQAGGQVPSSILKLIDLLGGQDDIKNKIIRTVGSPEKRFSEDALRMLRAIRFSAELGFEIEEETGKAIKKSAELLQVISKERIRDELIKIIMSDGPAQAFFKMMNLGLLKFIIPELEEGWGVEQNKHHIFTVWEHNMNSLSHAASKKWPLDIRLASMLHDIGKPAAKRGKSPDCTFYGHEVMGAKIAGQILRRLRFPAKFSEKTVKLVRWHLFFSDTEKITLSAVRRLLRKVGPENIWDLMKVRITDRVGMGRPKEEPYRLRKYEAMIEEVLHDPISVKMLEVNGDDVKRICGIPQSPKIGFLLNILLEEVLDEPKLNTKDYLEKRLEQLSRMSDKDLEDLAKKAKKKASLEEGKKIDEIHARYYVK